MVSSASCALAENDGRTKATAAANAAMLRTMIIEYLRRLIGRGTIVRFNERRKADTARSGRAHRPRLRRMHTGANRQKAAGCPGPFQKCDNGSRRRSVADKM